MIERNSRNFIIWEKPDGTTTLDLVPKLDNVDEDEIDSIFDTDVTSDLVEENEVLSRNSSVE